MTATSATSSATRSWTRITNLQGIEQVHEQVKLAREYLGGLHQGGKLALKSGGSC